MNNYVTASTIKTLREKKKMTQEQLANILSVSDKTVSKWERGKGLPEVSLMLPLCGVLNITVNDLLSGVNYFVVLYVPSVRPFQSVTFL